MVRLVFRPYTQLRRSICTSESLRSSIRVSPDFNLARHSWPSFGWLFSMSFFFFFFCPFLISFLFFFFCSFLISFLFFFFCSFLISFLFFFLLFFCLLFFFLLFSVSFLIWVFYGGFWSCLSNITFWPFFISKWPIISLIWGVMVLLSNITFWPLFRAKCTIILNLHL